MEVLRYVGLKKCVANLTTKYSEQQSAVRAGSGTTTDCVKLTRLLKYSVWTGKQHMRGER